MACLQDGYFDLSWNENKQNRITVKPVGCRQPTVGASVATVALRIDSAVSCLTGFQPALAKLCFALSIIQSGLRVFTKEPGILKHISIYAV